VRVLFLQQQPCVRALKIAVGLRTARPDVELGFAYQGRTLTEYYGSGDELFSRWWDLGDDPRGPLAAVLDEFRPDLVHSHNLPDTFTVLAGELAGARVPVVHDVHDLQSLRRTTYENGFAQPGNALALERRAIEGAAAVVTVSDELVAEIRRRYRLAGPTVVFPNYALRRDLPRRLAFASARRNGYPPRLVYQGTLSTNGGHYDLREIFAALVAGGATLDVYPSRDVPEYADLAAGSAGLTYHESLPPAGLLARLPAYDFGWAGFNETLNKAHIDTALPNKLFEYLACGLPVLTLRHRALRRFLRERGVGIALDSPSDLATELARRDVTKLRRRVAAARKSLTVEANAGRIADLYDSLVAVAA
jgi:glycosyltransferase involved in cell wall biosynthesis